MADIRYVESISDFVSAVDYEFQTRGKSNV